MIFIGCGGRRFDCSINNEAINGLLKYRDLTVEAINSDPEVAVDLCPASLV
jgi:hypothetical protein